MSNKGKESVFSSNTHAKIIYVHKYNTDVLVHIIHTESSIGIEYKMMLRDGSIHTMTLKLKMGLSIDECFKYIESVDTSDVIHILEEEKLMHEE